MEKFEDFTHTDELKNLLLSKNGKLIVDVDAVLSELQKGKQLINILNNESSKLNDASSEIAFIGINATYDECWIVIIATPTFDKNCDALISVVEESIKPFLNVNYNFKSFQITNTSEKDKLQKIIEICEACSSLDVYIFTKDTNNISNKVNQLSEPKKLNYGVLNEGSPSDDFEEPFESEDKRNLSLSMRATMKSINKKLSSSHKEAAANMLKEEKQIKEMKLIAIEQDKKNCCCVII